MGDFVVVEIIDFEVAFGNFVVVGTGIFSRLISFASGFGFSKARIGGNGVEFLVAFDKLKDGATVLVVVEVIGVVVVVINGGSVLIPMVLRIQSVITWVAVKTAG